VEREHFEQALARIDITALQQAKDFAAISYQDYRNTKGWFSCDDACMSMYNRYLQAAADSQFHEDAFAKALSDARASVGIFSEYGVADARERFWDSYYQGSAMAKRMSYWDALFMSIGAMRRDDSLMSVFINWLLNVAVNFTMGMISALISFMFHVGSLLFSYQASPASAISFFILAFCGAFAVIASFVVGAYMLAAATAFVALKASGNLTIEFPTQGPRRRIHRE